MSFSEAVAQLGLNTPWEDLITAMGGDPNSIALIKGVIATESQWNPSAVNPADPSYGLMQIQAGPRGPFPTINPSDLLDPSTNITLGATFLKSLVTRYGLPGAIAAYNAGHPMTNSAGQYVNTQGVPNVQAYVDSVLTYQNWYLNNAMGQVNYGTPPDATVPPLDASGQPIPQPVDTVPTDQPPADGGSLFSSTTFDIGTGIAVAGLVIGAIWMLTPSRT